MKASFLKTLRLFFVISIFFALPNKYSTQSPQIISDIKIEFSKYQFSEGSTQWAFTWENSAPNTWMAFGLNKAPQMVCITLIIITIYGYKVFYFHIISNTWSKVGACVVICARDSTGLPYIRGHYYNSEKSAPNLINPNDEFIGRIGSLPQILLSVDKFQCGFVRENSNPNSKYFNLNTNPSAYIIAAHGTLSSTGGNK